MIYFMTGITANYKERAMPFLVSLANHSEGITPLVITVDWSPAESEIPVQWVQGDSGKVCGLTSTRCLQHGGFIEFAKGSPDDIIVFCDADIVMQRNISPDEVAWLGDLKAGQVAVGPNAGEDETIAEESVRLRRTELCQPEPDWHKAICWNTGVVAALRATWERLYMDCSRMSNIYYPMFEHYAVQQLVISLALHRYYSIVVMPYTFHMHGHYQLPEGWGRDNELITYNGTPVLLRHRI